MELYRYNEVTDYGDEDNILEDPIAKVILLRFDVIRETNCCYVIKGYPKDRYISKCQHGKRYAYTTKEMALKSFGIRNIRRINILKDQLERTNKAREIYKNKKDELLAL